MKSFKLRSLLKHNYPKFLILILFCIQVQYSYSQKGEKETVYLENKLSIDNLIEWLIESQKIVNTTNDPVVYAISGFIDKTRLI